LLAIDSGVALAALWPGETLCALRSGNARAALGALGTLRAGNALVSWRSSRPDEAAVAGISLLTGCAGETLVATFARRTGGARGPLRANGALGATLPGWSLHAALARRPGGTNRALNAGRPWRARVALRTWLASRARGPWWSCFTAWAGRARVSLSSRWAGRTGFPRTTLLSALTGRSGIALGASRSRRTRPSLFTGRAWRSRFAAGTGWTERAGLPLGTGRSPRPLWPGIAGRPRRAGVASWSLRAGGALGTGRPDVSGRRRRWRGRRYDSRRRHDDARLWPGLVGVSPGRGAPLLTFLVLVVLVFVLVFVLVVLALVLVPALVVATLLLGGDVARLRETERGEQRQTGRADLAHRGAAVAEHGKVLQRLIEAMFRIGSEIVVRQRHEDRFL
jgi:hypothetical protein